MAVLIYLWFIDGSIKKKLFNGPFEFEFHRDDHHNDGGLRSTIYCPVVCKFCLVTAYQMT